MRNNIDALIEKAMESKGNVYAPLRTLLRKLMKQAFEAGRAHTTDYNREGHAEDWIIWRNKDFKQWKKENFTQDNGGW